MCCMTISLSRHISMNRFLCMFHHSIVFYGRHEFINLHSGHSHHYAIDKTKESQLFLITEHTMMMMIIILLLLLLIIIIMIIIMIRMMTMMIIGTTTIMIMIIIITATLTITIMKMIMIKTAQTPCQSLYKDRRI